MANQADKKNQKTKEQYAPIFFYLITGFIAINSLSLLYNIYQGNPLTLQVILFIIYTVINVFCYNNLINSLELGIGYSTYIDILGVNNLFSIVSMFTYKIFYLLYAIPAYLVWLVLKWIWGFMGTDYKKDPNEEIVNKKERRRREREGTIVRERGRTNI